MQTPLDGYAQEERQALALASEGKLEEAALIFDRWIGRHPTFREPHYQLAFALLSSAQDTAGQGLTPARRDRLQRAAAHFKRFVELSPDAESRAQGLDNLVETYLPASLNQPGEAEPYARALVASAPTWPQSYRQLAAVLRALGHTDAATKTLIDARASIQPDGRSNYVAHLKTHVTDSPSLPGDAAKQVIDVALAVNQDDLAATGMNYGNLTHKADLPELLAKRVEGNVARQKALLAESERLHADAAKLAAQLFKTGKH